MSRPSGMSRRSREGRTRWGAGRWWCGSIAEASTCSGAGDSPRLRRHRTSEADMSDEKTYKGKCFCGAVELTVTGEPAAMGFCHCTSCRQWSGGPVNAFTLWKHAAVEITKGAAAIGTYNQTEVSFRKWCKTCGG